jgi:hypothetical protein
MPRNATTTFLPPTGPVSTMYGFYDPNADTYRLLNDNLASRNFDGNIPKFAEEIFLYDSVKGKFNLEVGQYVLITDEYGVEELRLVTQIRVDDGNYYGASAGVTDESGAIDTSKSFVYLSGHPLAGQPTKVFIDYILPTGESKTYTVNTTLNSNGFPNNKVYAARENWSQRAVGSKGWIISGEGNAILNNLHVRGVIDATAGNFEGYVTVNSGEMRLGANVSTNGDDGIRVDANNYWYSDGTFKSGGIVDGAFKGIFWNPEVDLFSVTGDIKADTGYLGGEDGWIIAEGVIKAGGTYGSGSLWGDKYFLKNPDYVTDPAGTVVQFGDVFKVFKNGNVSISGSLEAESIIVDEFQYWNKNDDGKFRVGSADKYIYWDGNNLNVNAIINATGGTFTNTVNIGTGTNKIKLTGGTTDALTNIQIGTGGFETAPFYAEGTGKFSLGSGLSWNPTGSVLKINGILRGYIESSALTPVPLVTNAMGIGYHDPLSSPSTANGYGLGGVGIRLDANNYWYSTTNGFKIGDAKHYLRWYDNKLTLTAPLMSNATISSTEIIGSRIRGSDVFANSAQIGGNDYGWVAGSGGLFSGTSNATAYLQSGFHSNPIENITQSAPIRVGKLVGYLPTVTGKITANQRTNIVTGSGTKFTQELRRGYSIYVIEGTRRYFVGNVDKVISDTELALYENPNITIFIKNQNFYAYKFETIVRTQFYTDIENPQKISLAGTNLTAIPIGSANTKYQVGDEIRFDEIFLPESGSFLTGILSNTTYYVKTVTTTSVTITAQKQNVLADYSNNTFAPAVTYSASDAYLVLSLPIFSIEDSENSGFATFGARVLPRTTENTYELLTDSVPGPILGENSDSNGDGTVDEIGGFINGGSVTYVTPTYLPKTYVKNSSYLTAFVGEENSTAIEISKIETTYSEDTANPGEYFYNVYIYPTNSTKLSLLNMLTGENLYLSNIPVDTTSTEYNKLFEPLNDGYFPIIGFVDNNRNIVEDKENATGIVLYGDGYLNYAPKTPEPSPTAAAFSRDYTSYVVSSLSATDNKVTITTSSNHNFVVGKTVTITGFRETSYLSDDFIGEFEIIDVPAPNKFTYQVVFPDKLPTSIDPGVVAYSFPSGKIISFDKNYSLWIGASKPDVAPITIDPYGNKLKVKDLEVTGEVIGFYSDIIELDDFSSSFNGRRNTFTPKYNYKDVTVKNPLNLVVSLNGVIQSGFIQNKEYVWQSGLLSYRGFTLDTEGRIKFSESPPLGSTINVRVFPGPAKNKTARIYPFKAADIALG